MCNTLRAFGAQNRRDRHHFLMSIALNRAAEDKRRQVARRIDEAESERVQPLSVALTSPLSPYATAVAEAFRS